MSAQTKAMLASYARSVIAAVAAVASTGNTDPQDLGKAAVAAVASTGNTDPQNLAKAAVAALIPVVMRWANPKDPAYGRGNSQS